MANLCSEKTSLNREEENLNPGQFRHTNASPIGDDDGYAACGKKPASSEETGRCKQLYILEPGVFLYHVAMFAYSSLTSEYLHARFEPDTEDYQHTAFRDPLSNLILSYADPYGNASAASFHPDNFPGNVSSQIEAASDAYGDAVETWVSSEASTWLSYLSLVRGIAALPTILLILPYSDIKGRKIGLLVPCFGAILRCLTYLLVDLFQLPVAWLLVGHFLDGISGYHLTFVGAMYAYASDVTSLESRNFRFTLCQGCQLLGQSFASYTVGYMIAGLGYSYTFLFTLLVQILATLYIAFVLKETLNGMERSGGKKFNVADIVAGLKRMYQMVVKRRDDPLGRLTLIWVLLGITAFFIVSYSSLELESLFLLGSPYYLDSVEIGTFLFLLGLMNMIGPVLFVKLWTLCGITEVVMMILALLSYVIAFTIEATIINQNVLLTMTVLFGIGGSVVPVARCILSNLVSAEEQGVVHAVASFTSAVVETFSSTLMSLIFAATVSTNPVLIWFVFVAMCSFLTVYFICLVIIRTCHGRTEMYEEEESISLLE